MLLFYLPIFGVLGERIAPKWSQGTEVRNQDGETAMGALRLQLRDHRLTTAEILYHMPDHPHLLQSFIWQEYDLAPHFPALQKFLDFWTRNLDGRLHSVKVANQQLIQAPDTRIASALLTLQ